MTPLALRKPEAAKSIGVSIDFFEQHVQPELRLVRRGRAVLVPVRKLERWLHENAALNARAGEGRMTSGIRTRFSKPRALGALACSGGLRVVRASCAPVSTKPWCVRQRSEAS